MSDRALHVSRIVDHGTVVALAGRYVDDGTFGQIVMDRRPFAEFWLGWAKARHPQPVYHDEARSTVWFD
jgi:hypothetical protein